MTTCKILITIDVECALNGNWRTSESLSSIGTDRRIYGRIGSEQYGIHAIMDLLDKYNAKGEFFCDNCIRYLTSESEHSRVLNDIKQRGHNVALHVHPVFKFWGTDGMSQRIKKQDWCDDIGKLDLSMQDEFIDEGVDFIQRTIGEKPIAFRAGNYGATAQTMSVLAKHGIKYDSSYNLWAKYTSGYQNQGISDLVTNIPFEINGVTEIPVTNYFSTVSRGYRFFAPEGADCFEMKYVLSKTNQQLTPIVVFVLHSFTFLKNSGNLTNDLIFNKLTYKRLSTVLEYIAKNTEKFEFTEFGKLDVKKLISHKNVHSDFIKVPFIFELNRLFGQFKQKILR